MQCYEYQSSNFKTFAILWHTEKKILSDISMFLFYIGSIKQ